MMDPPTEVLYKIWSYSGPSSLYLNKSLLPYIEEKRLKFISKPLRLHYRLCRWKSNYYGIPSKKSRASIYVEQPEYIDVSTVRIGYVADSADNAIYPSTTLCDILIPMYRREGMLGSHSRIYWKVYTMWSEDDRIKEYSLLYPIVAVELLSEML